MHKVSNELSAIWAARFTNTSSSSVVCSDNRTPHTRRISCLRNLYRVSSYFSAGYERLRWLLDFRIIHSVQMQVSGSLASSSDYTTTGDEKCIHERRLKYTSKQHVCLINTTTDPRPNFSSLQNAWQTFAYTVPLVDICTCSWKTIEFMLASASEPATSFAWYSRTLRMRRGPNTNICTTIKIWKTPANM
jgi:hypothetical protein